MNKCQDKKVEKYFTEQLLRWEYTGEATWKTISDATRQRWRDWYTERGGKLEEK